MIFHNFLGDVKTEAGAALGLFSREIRIENSVQLRGVNTGAGIFDAQINVEIFLSACDGNGSLFLNRSLNRIHDYVLDCTVDLQRVTEQRA